MSDRRTRRLRAWFRGKCGSTTRLSSSSELLDSSVPPHERSWACPDCIEVLHSRRPLARCRSTCARACRCAFVRSIRHTLPPCQPPTTHQNGHRLHEDRRAPHRGRLQGIAAAERAMRLVRPCAPSHAASPQRATTMMAKAAAKKVASTSSWCVLLRAAFCSSWLALPRPLSLLLTRPPRRYGEYCSRLARASSRGSRTRPGTEILSSRYLCRRPLRGDSLLSASRSPAPSLLQARTAPSGWAPSPAPRPTT